ncbi:hypothetical protein [Mycobacterium deserti]|uniref:Transposase n=1 Tax=Mycobacterium deserti TaxID=2978347 RepID=A0ABT2MBU4_9MYCO|nr:hypothetical protein [Mycobacterium deserti]MCT7659727.1 hypothetical protein [Mycobacterium deserti]
MIKSFIMTRGITTDSWGEAERANDEVSGPLSHRRRNCRQPYLMH